MGTNLETKVDNKKGDILWGGALLVWILVLSIPHTREVFEGLTKGHPYIMGFVKFAILATMGDLLGSRVLNKKWIIPNNAFLKACIWGTIGMMVTLLFPLYNGGVMGAMDKGFLPFKGSKFFTAFFTSLIMNSTFGPTMYLYHKLMDTLLDTSLEKKRLATVSEVAGRVDWNTMIGFSFLITLPFIWVPLHTMVFFLPPAYRVLASAFLSIVLGLLVAISKSKKK